jgi:hypothetical protein
VSAFDVLERQLRDSARHSRRRRARLVPAVVAVAAASALIGVLLPRGPAADDERDATRPLATWTPQIRATISRSPLPPDQLEALAILRRRPTAADRSAAVRRLLRQGSQGMRGVRVDAIRLLAPRGAQTTILVPAERLAYRRGSPLDVLCVVSGLDGRGSGGTCGTFADLHQHGYIGWPGPPYGIVPDGVASVKLRVRGGRTITAPVRDNVYVVDEDVFAIQPPVWLDVNGHVIPRR